MQSDDWPQGPELIRRILAVFELTVENEETFIASFADTIQRRCGSALMPAQGDSLALSVMRPKTAALAYDRVYRFPLMREPVPPEVGFYGASPGEVAIAAGTLFKIAAEAAGVVLPNLPRSERSSAVNESESLRLIATAIGSGIGREPTLFYEHGRDQDREFKPGPEQVLTTAIRDLDLVDENELSWEQVLELRRDAEARRKYRRLVRWLDAELRSREPSEVIGAIEERLDDYQWAVRKHGLSTAMGVLSSVLDPKFLGGLSATVTAAAFAGGAGWAALAGASVGLGRALVSFGTAYVSGIDARRGSNYEIAYLHELQERR